MATKVHLADGTVVWGNFSPKPKPKLKELNNGFEIMARLDDRNMGSRIERCTVIEVTATEAVVEYIVKVWPRPVLRGDKKVYPVVEGKNYAEARILARIKPGQILAWAGEWEWHAKVMSGTPGGTWKCVGLLDQAVLNQLTMVA